MIDIEKFICSLLADHPEGITVRSDIHRALTEQGLEYKDGKIVPIEDKNELKEIVAWLEKQSQTFTKKDVDDAWLKGMCDAKHELEKQGEPKPTQRKDFISIPFGAYDSELVEESITIPDGCVTTIEGNRIHIKREGN